MDEHWVFAVALGGEQDDVVRARKVVERVAKRDFTQSYTAFPVAPFGHETPSFLLMSEALAVGFKLGVEAGQAVPKRVERAAEDVVGDEEVFFDIVGLDVITAFARQDDELAHDVLA